MIRSQGSFGISGSESVDECSSLYISYLDVHTSAALNTCMIRYLDVRTGAAVYTFMMRSQGPFGISGRMQI